MRTKITPVHVDQIEAGDLIRIEFEDPDPYTQAPAATGVAIPRGEDLMVNGWQVKEEEGRRYYLLRRSDELVSNVASHSEPRPASFYEPGDWVTITLYSRDGEVAFSAGQVTESRFLGRINVRDLLGQPFHGLHPEDVRFIARPKPETTTSAEWNGTPLSAQDASVAVTALKNLELTSDLHSFQAAINSLVMAYREQLTRRHELDEKFLDALDLGVWFAHKASVYEKLDATLVYLRKVKLEASQAKTADPGRTPQQEAADSVKLIGEMLGKAWGTLATSWDDTKGRKP
jgi:hypothetical protein